MIDITVTFNETPERVEVVRSIPLEVALPTLLKAEVNDLAEELGRMFGHHTLYRDLDKNGLPIAYVRKLDSQNAEVAATVSCERRAVDPDAMSLNELIYRTEQWHEARNLILGSTDKDQYMKLIQEMGELSDSICKGKDIRDDIGDIMVVLINIAKRNELSMQECLQVAYDDIKDRRGQMIDGVFVKEADLG